MVVLPFRGQLVKPDNTLSQGDRQHTTFMYSGIAASGAAAASSPIIMGWPGQSQTFGRSLVYHDL